MYCREASQDSKKGYGEEETSDIGASDISQGGSDTGRDEDGENASGDDDDAG